MTRKEKIELLKNIRSGKKPIPSLLDPIFLMWKQVEHTDNFCCNGKVFNINELPTHVDGRASINIIVYNGSTNIEIFTEEY